MKSKAIMSAILVCIQVIILLTGCTGNGYGENATFVLSHYSGVDSSEVYDTELLYKNKSDVWGSDACVIYVPKERDKVYGGYYYMYLSTNAGIDSNESTFAGEDGEIYRESTQVLRSKDLVELQAKAAKSGLPEDAQAANDFANLIGRFEKKIHDLELTRMISLQMSPQIRMVQNNDMLMSEKIQTAIVNTIPLWKSQMVLALSLHHSKQAMEASRSVSDVTNELLLKNAQDLRMGSVEIAKESERGIVELETLKKTNEHLIATLDEVRQAQDEGRARRSQAELELGRIEAELKQKLLDMKG